jgi:hypothetical protein
MINAVYLHLSLKVVQQSAMYIRGWYLPAVTFESYLCSYPFQKGLGKAFSASVAVICFQLMLNH